MSLSYQVFVGLTELTLESKFPLCCVLLHSVGLSSLFPIEFCFLIAVCSGKHVLAEASGKKKKQLNGGPLIHHLVGTCLSMNNSLFAYLKEKLRHHGTSQHCTPSNY